MIRGGPRFFSRTHREGDGRGIEPPTHFQEGRGLTCKSSIVPSNLLIYFLKAFQLVLRKKNQLERECKCLKRSDSTYSWSISGSKCARPGGTGGTSCPCKPSSNHSWKIVKQKKKRLIKKWTQFFSNNLWTIWSISFKSHIQKRETVYTINSCLHQQHLDLSSRCYSYTMRCRGFIQAWTVDNIP